MARPCYSGACAVALTLLLVGCSSSQEHTVPAAPNTPLVVLNDSGGNVASYVKLRSDLEAAGTQVQMRGYNRSSATILMTLPNACLGRNASFGFHEPSTVGVPLLGAVIERGGAALIGSYYRAGIKKRWDEEWSRKKEITRISAAEAVALDPELKICE